MLLFSVMATVVILHHLKPMDTLIRHNIVIVNGRCERIRQKLKDFEILECMDLLNMEEQKAFIVSLKTEMG